MDDFKLKTLYSTLTLEPRGEGGACLYVEDEIEDVYSSATLTRLELVALRDWLIAYTG